VGLVSYGVGGLVVAHVGRLAWLWKIYDPEKQKYIFFNYTEALVYT
jgi:hypothetical protein